MSLQSRLAALISAIGGDMKSKEPAITAGTAAQYRRGDKTWQTLNKAAVGLANADNTSDANKPVSTAQQTALSLKYDKTGGLITGAVAVEGSVTCYSSGSTINFGGFAGVGSNVMTLYGEGKSIELRPTSRTDNTQAVQINTSSFLPVQDNAKALGLGSFRWSTVYAATGAINTSDAREKAPPRHLNEAEIAAATEIARLPSIFQWLHALAEKGDAARLHCSPTVQAVIGVMEAHGLDPFRYGFICYDEWDEQQEIVESWPEERDEDGNILAEAGSQVVQEYRPAGNRYSLRPSGLSHFISASIVARLDAAGIP